MPRARSFLAALLPLALHGLAREVDAAVGLLLHTTLDLPGFVGEALSLIDVPSAAGHVLLWTSAGGVAWGLLAWERRRREGGSLAEALDAEAGTFAPLYLRPALTLLALVSLAVQPTYPYGFTLPVALTQDWGIAQDALALAAILALRMPAMRLPAPRAGGLFFMAFLAYALLTPEWAREWRGHPGNEPKYLRMGVALGWSLSLDVEGVSDVEDVRPPMEAMDPEPVGPAVERAASVLARETGRMAAALLRGPQAVGASAIRATHLARQTIAGKEGGVFHVLAPGPSLLLAPTLRVDRFLNLLRGTPGRLAVTVLAWNAMGAALVVALFLLLRDATGRTGLSALVAGGFGLAPPFLFYFFQFYPEMPGALLMTLALRALLFGRPWTPRAMLLLGLLLTSLPWLHQKFLAVWLVLTAMAILRAVDALVSFRALMALVLPQVATLFLFALYNFAITGSVRPDALFLAWGPGGVTSARIGEGFLGLLLDARYGILPCAPVYLLAAGGFAASGLAARRLRWALPAVLAYYLTVAAADNWSGSVCNLGRYIMPALPLLVVLAGVALDRAWGRRGVLAVAVALATWTAVVSLRLWSDPRAANDSAVLLARSVFADPNVYLPNLFFRSWNYAAPGHAARILAWILAAVALGVWIRRAAGGGAAESARRALIGLVTVVLVSAAVLERWPTPERAPRFPEALDAGSGVTAFASGAAIEGDHLRATPGNVDLLVRSRTPQDVLRVTATGAGTLRLWGRAPLAVTAAGTRLDLPLAPLRTLTGRRGAQESLARGALRVESGTIALRIEAAPRPE